MAPTICNGISRFRYLSSSLRSSSLHVRYPHNRVRYLSQPSSLPVSVLVLGGSIHTAQLCLAFCRIITLRRATILSTSFPLLFDSCPGFLPLASRPRAIIRAIHVLPFCRMSLFSTIILKLFTRSLPFC